MRFGYYPWWDSTYILVVIGAVICMLASAKVKTTFRRYSGVRSHTGLTGAKAAEVVLHAAGIYDVTIRHVSGELTDHYDPRNKTLNLSDSVYGSASVAAVGVAAHECGHAIQHQKHYAPLSFRSWLVPVANFGATISWPLIILGLIIRSNTAALLIDLGILCFSFAVLFQLVTLPVELNASRRALHMLKTTGTLDAGEVSMTRKVLGAAALTYVAGAASSILQLLRLIILTGGRRDD